VTLSLRGVDAGDFVLKGGALSFMSPPDFEAPRDADKNNVYSVTIVATDSGGLTRSQNLSVTVRNIIGNSVVGDNAGNLLDASHSISGGKFTTREEDRIDGKRGDDAISAGDGNDTIIGGLGKDSLTGGAGTDRFVFNTAPAAANVDTVRDFKHDIDILVLDDAIYRTIGPSLSGGELYAAAGATQAHDGNDRIIYDTRTGRLFYDADGDQVGGVAAIQIATLSGHPAIDAGDLMVV
jgi:serralysin